MWLQDSLFSNRFCLLNISTQFESFYSNGPRLYPGFCFNIKMLYYQYRKSHCGKIRPFYDCHISTTEFLILVRQHLYREFHAKYVTHKLKDMIFTVSKISARPRTLTGKTGFSPASFASLPCINFGKVMLQSSKFQILFWRLFLYIVVIFKGS